MNDDRSSYLVTNNKLLEETLNDFSQKPFQFASLNEIVKRADFNKGSFYYRFEDKEALYLALIDLINSQHLVLYNEAILSLRKPYRPISLAMAAFDTLRQLALIDSRYPLVLERFSLEDESFQKSIRSKSLSFVYERLLHDLRHAGCDLTGDADAYNAFRQLYHALRIWPVDSRDQIRLKALIEVVFHKVPISPVLRSDDRESAALINIENKKGLILAFGSRQCGKSTIAKNTFQSTNNDLSSGIYIDVQTQTVTDRNDRLQKTVPLIKFAALGKRRLRNSPSDWSHYLRLSKEASALSFAIFEALSRTPKRLIIDEPMLACEASEFSLILATLLKYSTTNSTMIVTSTMSPELWTSATEYAFLSSQTCKSQLNRQELIEKYPSDQLWIRCDVQGIERSMRLTFAPEALTAFQTKHPNAALTDLRVLTNDWSAIYKIETGEEFL